MITPSSLSHRAQAKLHNGLALAEEAGEAVADQANAALHLTERKASDTLGSIAAGVDELRRSVPLALRRAADEARYAGRATAGYVRDEPVKSALMAAAAGALVIGLVTFFNRRR